MLNEREYAKEIGSQLAEAILQLEGRPTFFNQKRSKNYWYKSLGLKPPPKPKRRAKTLPKAKSLFSKPKRIPSLATLGRRAIKRLVS